MIHIGGLLYWEVFLYSQKHSRLISRTFAPNLQVLIKFIGPNSEFSSELIVFHYQQITKYI